MLDYIRRQNIGIKVVLGLVVLSFVIFYAGSFTDQSLDDSSRYMAKVGSEEVGFVEFQNMLKVMEEQHRQLYQGREMGSEMINFMRQQALNSLVDRKLLLLEAKKAGVKASEEEIHRNILRAPYFLDNGTFVELDEYERRVDMLFHLRMTEFEKMVGDDIVVSKFNNLLTGGILVSDQEIEEQYRKTSLTAKIDYVSFETAQAGSDVQVTAEEARAYYDSHKQEFQTGELRKVQYLWVSHDSEKNRVQIPEEKLREHFNSNQQKYSRPEQVHARHILLKTEGKQDADVLKQAQDIVQQLRAGADFVELAKRYSEDPGSKDNGGDLGFFERGRMVPEFEQAAFSLQPNQLSAPVKTQYGYHIIQVLEKRPAYQMDFALVKDQIYREISMPQAIKNAQDQAQKVYEEITKNKKSMTEISKIQLVEIRNTDYFAKNEDLPGLSPAFREKAFELKKGQIGEPVQVFQNYALIQLLDTKPTEVPPFANIEVKVTQKVRQQKLEQTAREKAQKFYQSVAGSTELKTAAEKEKLTVKTSEEFPKGGYLGELGNVPEVSEAAFSMKVGEISKPAKTERGFIVYQLKEKKEFDPTEFAKEKDTVRQQIWSEKEGSFMQAYRAMLRKKYEKEIWINQEAISPRET